MKTAVFSAAAALVVLASWMASAQQAPGVRALVDARLFDGTGAPPIEPATILIRDGRVAAAGRADAVVVPAGAERISLRGKTVIPGLVNAHGHVNDAARDLATYAYLTDVIVAESARGEGIGSWMVEAILAHPDLQGLRRVALYTRDARALYERYGFTTDRPASVYMELRPR